MQSALEAELPLAQPRAWKKGKKKLKAVDLPLDTPFDPRTNWALDDPPIPLSKKKVEKHKKKLPSGNSSKTTKSIPLKGHRFTLKHINTLHIPDDQKAQSDSHFSHERKYEREQQENYPSFNLPTESQSLVSDAHSTRLSTRAFSEPNSDLSNVVDPDGSHRSSPSPGCPDRSPQQPPCLHRRCESHNRSRSLSIPSAVTLTALFGGKDVTQRVSKEESLLIQNCRNGTTSTEVVAFSPYALYRVGANRIYECDMGYAQSGDLLLNKSVVYRMLREPGTSSKQRSQSQLSRSQLGIDIVVDEALNLGHGSRYPGIRVLKGRKSRERYRLGAKLHLENTHNEKEQSIESPLNAPLFSVNTINQPPLAVQDVPELLYSDQECTLESRLSHYHNPNSGEVASHWKPFIHITEEQQSFLLKPNRNTEGKTMEDPAVLSPQQRYERLSLDHKSLLCSVSRNKKLIESLESIEKIIRTWCLSWYYGCPPLLLHLEDRCDRKLSHLIAHYYQLRSNSSTNTETHVRSTTIDTTEKSRIPRIPSKTLLKFLNYMQS